MLYIVRWWLKYFTSTAFSLCLMGSVKICCGSNYAVTQELFDCKATLKIVQLKLQWSGKNIFLYPAESTLLV